MRNQNIGGLDTAVRAVLGSLIVVLAALSVDQHPFWALAVAPVALVLLGTAIAGSCPLYTVLGFDTRLPGRTPRKVQPKLAHQLR